MLTPRQMCGTSRIHNQGEHEDKYIFRAVKDGPLPEAAHFADYSGSYDNDELRATWTLIVQDGKLVRQQWMTEDQEVEPSFPDGFTADSEVQFLMHFNRDGSGRVTSFDVATDMVRPMIFVRTGNGSAAKKQSKLKLAKYFSDQSAVVEIWEHKPSVCIGTIPPIGRWTHRAALSFTSNPQSDR